MTEKVQMLDEKDPQHLSHRQKKDREHKEQDHVPQIGNQSRNQLRKCRFISAIEF